MCEIDLASALDRPLNRRTHVRRAVADFKAGVFERRDLVGGRTFAAADDGAGVTHALSWRSRLAGDERGERFLDVLLGELGRFFFGRPADFADHQDRFGLRVVLEHLEEINLRCADDWVTADADASRLAEAEARQLPHRFVGQRARAADDADAAGLVNVAGHDADLAFAGRDDAGAVRPDEDALARLDDRINAGHVDDGDAFGDRADHADAGVDRFENRVGSECRRDEDHRRIGAGLLYGFFDGVKDGQPFDRLASFARRDAADHFRAVFLAPFGMELADVAGNALADNARVFVDQDRHE